MRKLFLITLFYSLASNAATELRVKAMQEAQAPRVIQKSATDAQITDTNLTSAATSEDGYGVLILNDPSPQNIKRSYNWVLGVKVQNYQPTGLLTSKDTPGVQLSDISAFNMPSLEFGVLGLGNNPEKTDWSWGVLGHVGYGSQKSEVAFYTSTVEDNARLNTLLSDLGVSFDFELGPRWGLSSSLGMGLVTYSHTGSTSFSQFSEQASFRFATLGAYANVMSRWQIFTTYSNRNLMNNDKLIAIPTDSAELGTRLIW